MPDVSIKMANSMITASNFVLQQREIKGRQEMRTHKRILNALIKDCSEEREGQKVTKENALVMEKGDWESLYAYCEEKIKAGFPASLNDGMCDLMDQIEKLAKVEEDPEDKKEPPAPVPGPGAKKK